MNETRDYFTPASASDPLPGQATIYVKFGPAPHQEIRAEVAGPILSAWREKSPKQFGEALAAAMLADRNGHQ